ncbi:MAG: glutamate 5-kinase, partial [Oscillospiraceae bacterium]|nr:glutamate 5-kinase [Oscillospiraceae bacterium]
MDSGEKQKRIVVKVGTSTLTWENGNVQLHHIDLLARALSDLKGMGHEVILVSSGAIAIGIGKLGMQERPAALRMTQAAAAVG